MFKLRLTSRTVLVGLIICVAWLVLVFSTPFMVPSGTLKDLSGRVGTRENIATFSDLGIVPRAVYTIGDVECHQIADRSYFLNGNQMPVCSRDVGLFAGLVLGFAAACFVRFKGNPVLLLLGLVPLAVDGGLQLVTRYESNNPLRLATGIVAGTALALLLALYIHAIEELEARPSEGHKIPPT